MRATVLCFLVLAGATCALQLPSLLSPKSLSNVGSSLMNGNIPNLNSAPPKKRDQSDESNSSEDDDDSQTGKLATDLTNRLVKVIQQALGSATSTAELPFKLGFGMVNSLVAETQDWIKDNIPGAQKNAQQTLRLAFKLGNSIVSDIMRSIGNIGYNLAHGFSVTAELENNIKQDVAQWLKDIVPPEQSESSSERSESSSSERSSRQARGLGDVLSGMLGGFSQLLNASPVGKLAAALAPVDFSQITESVPKIEEPADVDSLPNLPGLKDKLQQARNLTTQALAPEENDLPTAIQSAMNDAIQSENPVGAIVNLEYNILQTYYNVARSSPVPKVSKAITQEGMQLVQGSVNSLLSVLSQDAQDAVSSLLD